MEKRGECFKQGYFDSLVFHALLQNVYQCLNLKKTKAGDSLLQFKHHQSIVNKVVFSAQSNIFLYLSW